jgi:hypothetical protein
MHALSPSDFNAPTPLMLGTVSRSLRRDLSRAVRRAGPVFREADVPAGRVPQPRPRNPQATATAPITAAASLSAVRAALLLQAWRLRGENAA